MDLEPNLPEALVDTKQFEYAFRNVFFNAMESLDEEKGGSIYISTRRVQLFVERFKKGVTEDYVELQIQDTGKGIPAEILENIAQPYFTTKSGGTGLGLSIVQKIMDSHGGDLEIQSQEGSGTTVSLRFKVAIRQSNDTEDISGE